MTKDMIPCQTIDMDKVTVILQLLTPAIEGTNRRIIEIKIASRDAGGVVKQDTSKLVAEQG